MSTRTPHHRHRRRCRRRVRRRREPGFGDAAFARRQLLGHAVQARHLTELPVVRHLARRQPSSTGRRSPRRRASWTRRRTTRPAARPALMGPGCSSRSARHAPHTAARAARAASVRVTRSHTTAARRELAVDGMAAIPTGFGSDRDLARPRSRATARVRRALRPPRAARVQPRLPHHRLARGRGRRDAGGVPQDARATAARSGTASWTSAPTCSPRSATRATT